MQWRHITSIVLQVLASVGGANQTNWPSLTPTSNADTTAMSLVAYAKANNLDGHDYNLGFKHGPIPDWVT